MKRMIVALICIFHASALFAQDISGIESIRRFLGASSEEDMDAYEVELLEDYLSKPLRLNQDGEGRIMASGLLSRYQAASLADYRRNYGDVLSLSELAAVSGFNTEIVELLAPFISLASSTLPGVSYTDEKGCTHDIAVRSGHKFQESEISRWNWGVKYRLDTSAGIGAALSVSKPYDVLGAALEFITGSLSWTSARSGFKVVAGDFNARFGQGLAFWNGMVLSGLSSPSSFCRSASGISRSWSFTGSSAVSGIAASVPIGRFVISSLLSFPGIKESVNSFSIAPVVNVAWYGKNGQVSFTNHMQFSGFRNDDLRIPHLKSAIDMRWCIRGTDVFSEVAYDWVGNVVAGLLGMDFRVRDNMRTALIARYYPTSFDSYMSGAVRSGTKCSNELAFSASCNLEAGNYVRINGAEGFGSSVKRFRFMLSADAAAFPESKSDIIDRTWQSVMIFQMQAMLNSALRMDVRLKNRYRNWEDDKSRTDIRMDLCFLSKRFVSTLRVNALHNVGLGLLSYLEAGYKAESFTLYLRQGFFRIDNWDDRIYVYERDAPGNFSVPAYYGRGLWTALTGSWKFTRWGRLYARASLLSYPFMEKKKPGKAELKLQAVFSF